MVTIEQRDGVATVDAATTPDAPPQPAGDPRAAAPPPGGQRPSEARAADRTVALMASDGVAYLLYWLVILVLLGQSVGLALQPPQGDLGVGLWAGFVCFVWAGFCLGMGLLRGKTPQGTDLPPPVWLPLITTIGCTVSLATVHTSAQTTAPWGVQLVVAGLLVAAMTLWRGPVAGALSGVVLGGLVLLAPLLADQAGTPLRTPLSRSLAGLALIGAGFAVALALGWMRRSAQRLQALLDARQDALVREEAVRAAARVAAELERSLHDTALNTLETIAAHGEHLDPAAVVARCRADVQRLSEWRSESGFVGLGEVVGRLVEHADRIGLHLDVEVLTAPAGAGEPRVALTPPVLHAFAGAASEALTNVAKHSGVRRASILVAHDPGGLQMLVSDEGIGPGGADGGFGVASSVLGRMESVGGIAVVTHGPDGVGTAVLLSWEPPAPAPSTIGTDLLVRTAGVVVAVASAMAGIACALVVLGWAAYAHPVAALAMPFLPVLTAAWLVDQARTGIRIGPSHVLLVCAVYVLLGAGALLTDPFCSTLVAQGVLLDVRVPLVATMLLLAPRAGVVLSIAATLVVTHAVAAVAWADRGLGCGPGVTGSGVYFVAGLAAVWLFARRTQRVADQYAQARAQAMQAEVRIRSQLSLRAEEELWVADTLASAQELLGAIADGRRPPTEPATRAACGHEAGFLRALLAVGRAPEALRRPARVWMRLLHAAGCEVTVRGTFADCRPPAAVVGQVGGVLDTIAAMAPGCAVTLSTWAEPSRGALTVLAAGPRVAHAGDPLESRIHRVAGRAWREFGGDTITVEWTWLRGATAVSAVDS